MQLTEDEIHDQEVLIELANKLNVMLSKDRKAISAIFSAFHIVRPELAESSAMIFEISPSVYAVNVLGIVAGTASLKGNSFSLSIDMVSDELLGFKVVSVNNNNT